MIWYLFWATCVFVVYTAWRCYRTYIDVKIMRKLMRDADPQINYHTQVFAAERMMGFWTQPTDIVVPPSSVSGNSSPYQIEVDYQADPFFADGDMNCYVTGEALTRVLHMALHVGALETVTRTEFGIEITTASGNMFDLVDQDQIHDHARWVPTSSHIYPFRTTAVEVDRDEGYIVDDPSRFWVDDDQIRVITHTRQDDDSNYLDLEKCWRCTAPVPKDDALGLCQPCVQALQEA